MKTDFDLLIVGGGMVGASLACAVQHLPLRAGLVEATAPDITPPSFDARAIALSQGSKRILEALGLWQALQGEATPIQRIHVSDRGHFASATLSAQEEGVEALGYVVEAAAMGRVFETALTEVENCEWLRPAQVIAASVQSDHATLRLQTSSGERAVTTRLLIAADGGRSYIREQLGEESVHLGYGQTAIIAYVTTDAPHNFVAYERFTDTGPLAMLPCSTGTQGERRWSLVWTARDEEVEEILALPDKEFLSRLQARLGYRAGLLIGTGPRQAHPLVLHYLRDYARPRLIFIGNAAHTIHPVGGQGYNLGLRDVAALAEVLGDCAVRDVDVGGTTAIENYRAWRKSDYARVLGLTHSMARIFSADFLPFIAARSAGLMGIELFPPLKRLFARQFMGLLGRQPRLARGVKLTA